MSRKEAGGDKASPRCPMGPGGGTRAGETDEVGLQDWDDDPGEAPTPPASQPAPTRRRPASPSPAGTDMSGATAEQVADHFAGHLAETSSSAFMYFTLAGVFRQADALAFKKYRDKLLADCGAPADPIEIMLIEQLALAHLNTGRLHYKSATAEGLEEARTYGALAIALAGEMRRTALAIKAYRAKPQVATVGVGPAATAERPGPVARASENAADGELGSNPGGEEHDGGTIPLPESATGRGGPAEPGQTSRPERRRA